MEQLERSPEELWDERRLWFEEQEARHARVGARAPSEQACALMIDLQAVFCAGAWAAVVILACAVTEAQGGSRRESLPGVTDREDRKRGAEGKSVAVRVEPGGRRISKQKNNTTLQYN